VRGTSDRRLPSEVWEVLAASAMVAWRFRTHPAAGLWRDWVVVLGVWWIATAIAGRTKAWPALLGLMMAFLFAQYAALQVPLSLAVLR
jgi:hypothetical protein